MVTLSKYVWLMAVFLIPSDDALLSPEHEIAANENNAAIIFSEAKINLSICADRVSAQTLKLGVCMAFIIGVFYKLCRIGFGFYVSGFLLAFEGA